MSILQRLAERLQKLPAQSRAGIVGCASVGLAVAAVFIFASASKLDICPSVEIVTAICLFAASITAIVVTSRREWWQLIIPLFPLLTLMSPGQWKSSKPSLLYNLIHHFNMTVLITMGIASVGGIMITLGIAVMVNKSDRQSMQ